MNFCSKCGSSLAQDKSPQACSSCDTVFYENPTPVGVAVIPVTENGEVVGVLGVRRGMNSENGANRLALPGGFADIGETAEVCAARELLEETSLVRDSSQGRVLHTGISSNKRQMLLFVEFPSMDIEEVKNIRPSAGFEGEVLDGCVLSRDNVQEVVFSTHAEVVELYSPSGRKPAVSGMGR